MLLFINDSAVTCLSTFAKHLKCARHCPKHFAEISNLILTKPYHVGTIINSMWVNLGYLGHDKKNSKLQPGWVRMCFADKETQLEGRQCD